MVAGGYNALDEAVACGFFEHYLSVFAEEFDKIGRTFLIPFVFGLEFCKLTRAPFGKFEFTVSSYLGNLFLGDSRGACFTAKLINTRSARYDLQFRMFRP